MKDDDYNELKLRVMIVPEQANWPEPKYVHWERIYAVPNEARARVGKAYAAMDKIEHDVNLTNEGKRNARARVAEQAVADLQKSDTLEQARAAVERQCQLWDDKFGLSEIIKPAEDYHTAVVHGQVRDKLAAMDTQGRMAFLQRHGGDPLVASALLTAPSFISGLSDAEAAMVRSKVERSVIPPEVAEARAATEKAMLAAEKGWQTAINKIGERAGLTRSPDGTWHDPSRSKAA